MPCAACGAAIMRIPTPWYSATRSGGGWFAQIDGTQVLLGKHPIGEPAPKKRKDRWYPPRVILDEFHRMMAIRDTASQADHLVEVVCAMYLEHGEVKRPDLVERYEPILTKFC